MENPKSIEIIYIGDSLQTKVAIESSAKKLIPQHIHLKSLSELSLKKLNYEQSDDTQLILIVDFLEFDNSSFLVLNYLQSCFPEILKVLIFENQEELSIHYNLLNKFNVYPFLKGVFFQEQLKIFYVNQGFLQLEEELLEVSNMDLETNVHINLYIEKINKDYIIINKPSFSKEIEKADFDIRFPELNLKYSNTDKTKITYENESIIIRDDFSNLYDKLDILKIDKSPNIKLGYFANLDESEEITLYNSSNFIISKYQEFEESCNEQDLIIIDDTIIEDELLSKRILANLDFTNNKVVIIFNNKTSSRAFQKVYNYNKILAYYERLEIQLLSKLMKKFQENKDTTSINLDQTETLCDGSMIIKSKLVFFSEYYFQVQLPFNLKPGVSLTIDAFDLWMGNVINSEKVDGKYMIKALYGNIDENLSNALRRYLNHVIYLQERSNKEDENTEESESA